MTCLVRNLWFIRAPLFIRSVHFLYDVMIKCIYYFSICYSSNHTIIYILFIQSLLKSGEGRKGNMHLHIREASDAAPEGSVWDIASPPGMTSVSVLFSCSFPGLFVKMFASVGVTCSSEVPLIAGWWLCRLHMCPRTKIEDLEIIRFH